MKWKPKDGWQSSREFAGREADLSRRACLKSYSFFLLQILGFGYKGPAPLSCQPEQHEVRVGNPLDTKISELPEFNFQIPPG